MTMGEIGCFLSHYIIWQDVSVWRLIFSCLGAIDYFCCIYKFSGRHSVLTW